MNAPALNRREFLASTGAAMAAPAAENSRVFSEFASPLAITMWDFSWLERRWPGAGYEDWDRALDELSARGYNAVRIDAYPHLVAAGAEKTWDLLPCWSVQDWGSPARNRVQVQPGLNTFIQKCRDRSIRVGLSTWFRQDAGNKRMQIHSGEQHGQIWKTTLDTIAAAGLAKDLLYVDLCNEWPLDVWAPFVSKGFRRTNPACVQWMRDATQVVRTAYPSLPLTFSITSEWDTWKAQDVSTLDFLELHIWMAQSSDFNEQVGYHYERFDSKGYDNLVERGKRLYSERPGYWQGKLRARIALAAEWSRTASKPLITTECWSVVDYKDWPLLEWDWIKELCQIGVTTAAATGRWAAIATSNFCGPQFVGMWRDVEWHRRLTSLIRSASLPR